MNQGRNRITVVLLVLSLLVFGATAAFAAQGGMQHGHHGKQMFMAKGVVTAIVPVEGSDPPEVTLTVTVEKANRTLKALIGEDVEFTVPDTVRVKAACTDDFDLTLDDVAVDDTVRVFGRVVDGAYVVRQIILY